MLNKRIGVISLGCPKNLVDTEVVLGLIGQAGFAPASDLRDAGVALLNTCGFIEPARVEAYQALRDLGRWKKDKAGRIVVVFGCLPQREKVQIAGRFPFVEAWFGTGQFAEIQGFFRQLALKHESRFKKSRNFVRDQVDFSYLEKSQPRCGRVLSTPPYTAYLKIAEGCSHHCTFCLIPRLRGRQRSFSVEGLITEAESLVLRGVREINIVAQDTTAYGQDKKGRDRLPGLLRRLARVKGLRWLRLLYAYPANLSDEVLEVMAAEKKICHYVDIPFQHASSRILKLMGRPGSRSELAEVVARVRRYMPDAAVRSSFIVGFPGETEKDFNELEDLLETVRFDWAGFFPFFAEKGSAASRLPDQVPGPVKQTRLKKVYGRQQKITQSLNRSWLGKKLQVLVEKHDAQKDLGRGRSFRDAPEIDGAVLFRTDNTKTAPRPGQFVPVLVTGVRGYDLVGQCLK